VLCSELVLVLEPELVQVQEPELEPELVQASVLGLVPVPALEPVLGLVPESRECRRRYRDHRSGKFQDRSWRHGCHCSNRCWCLCPGLAGSLGSGR
jgi:hypothetical protein